MNYYKFDREVTSKDLENFKYPNRKVGVIIHIVDEMGRILLQQRGVKSRDENGLYEDVGGKIEESDIDYRAAIIREMNEEMGMEVEIDLGRSN